jgi:hypothetical protein
VKKFYQNNIYDHRPSIQYVPVFRLHSAQIQPVPLTKMGGPDPDTIATKTAFRRVLYTHLQWGPRGKNNSEAPHISDSSTLLSIFMLYFTEIVTLLVVQTDRYYHWCMDSLEEGLFSNLT